MGRLKAMPARLSGLAARVKVNCFRNEPSIASSLKFLRRTPWARAEVEQLYLAHVRRHGAPKPAAAAP